MRSHSLVSRALSWAALVVVGSACATRANYLELAGPRYAADHVIDTEALALDLPDLGAGSASGPSYSQPSQGATLTVVSYNLRYGREVDLAIEILGETPELAGADIYLLQEMGPEGVDRIARALGCAYVYYPASLRDSGREFGNAVLTRHCIVEDEKVLLPHKNPFNRQRRIAVRTDVDVDGRGVHAFSVHTETPFLSVARRMDQIQTLLESVPDGDRPCLIAGDFNTMGNRSLTCFERAFAERGFSRASEGMGYTFSFGPFGYGMDHVFVRGLEVVDQGKVDVPRASDHVPIWVELAWPGEQG